MSRVNSLSPTRLPIGATKISGRSVDLEHVVNATLAVLILVFLAPLMITIAMCVYLYDGGPMFFAHRRIGRGGVSFPCLKFRSMAVDAETRLERLLATDGQARREWEADHKLRIDPRITGLGDFLRRSSLDELPQLFNVVRGEMSLVGPRPVVQGEAVKYGRRFASYCSVRPGITGLWQVSGRNDVCYRERVALDVLYARRKSLAMDAGILIKTVPAVLLRRGSY